MQVMVVIKHSGGRKRARKMTHSALQKQESHVRERKAHAMHAKIR